MKLDRQIDGQTALTYPEGMWSLPSYVSHLGSQIYFGSLCLFSRDNIHVEESETKQ